jgi:P-type E1-E2 ATPase
LPTPEVFRYQPGKGILARVSHQPIFVGTPAFLAENGVEVVSRGNDHDISEVFVAKDGRFLGSITLDDQERPEAAAAIQSLREMRIRTILLTGDAAAAGQRVAKLLQVDQVFSELLPDQKRQSVQALVRHKKTVAMVGDGVNDAPALAEANVGVAMGSGTDVARESADVVLIGNDLAKFVTTVRIARKNFYGTLAVDSVGMGLAAFGLLNPLLAAFIHVASELIFILNSARLLPSSST